jgi:hypothetical protein
MREPVYKIVNDDDPGDYAYPMAVSARTIREAGDFETLAAITFLPVRQSVTVGGGAAVQFTITRIR